MTGSLSEPAERLRKAISGGAFEEARARLLELRRRLEEALRALPPGDPRGVELIREAGALLAWARRAVLTARAHTALRLEKGRPAGTAYRTGTRHSWTLNG